MKNTSKLFLFLTVSASSFAATAHEAPSNVQPETLICEDYLDGYIDEKEAIAELEKLDFTVHETDVFCESLEAGVWVRE